MATLVGVYPVQANGFSVYSYFGTFLQVPTSGTVSMPLEQVRLRSPSSRGSALGQVLYWKGWNLLFIGEYSDLRTRLICLPSRSPPSNWTYRVITWDASTVGNGVNDSPPTVICRNSPDNGWPGRWHISEGEIILSTSSLSAARSEAQEFVTNNY